MLIEIHCGNLSDYDPRTGRSRTCSQIIMVDSSQIGNVVECPKCHQPVEISASKYENQSDLRKAASSAASSASTGKAAKARPAPPAKPGLKPPSRPVANPKQRRPAEPKSARPQAKSAPSQELRSRPDPMAMEISDLQLESMLANDQGTRCTKCGHPAPRGRCTACRYVDKRFEKLHRPLDEIKIELTGLQRWSCQTLSEGMSMQILINVSHLFVAILSVLLITLSVMGIAGIGMPPTGAILLLSLTLLMDAFYLGLVYKGYQFLKNPRARLAWFQKPFWNLLLTMARWMEWKGYDSRLKDRRVITIHDPDFSDFQIGQLEGIRNVQVLDLERTGITDRGLALMYRLEHLQCVVVRRTQVTPEAVFRLQQSFPRLWVWQ